MPKGLVNLMILVAMLLKSDSDKKIQERRRRVDARLLTQKSAFPPRAGDGPE